MNNPAISCIVASFNSERYIKAALDSIVGQTYRPLEIIVADDGSTDGTRTIVSGFGESVNFVSQETAGPAATRNLGVNQTNCDFLAFLDADDIWHPQKLELQMNRFKSVPDLEVSVCHTKLIWNEEVHHEEDQYRDHPRNLPVPGYTTGAMLVKRSVFDKIGLLNQEYWYGDAVEWFLRARENGVVIDLLPDVLLFHRMHESNLTRRGVDACRREYLDMVKQALDRRRKAKAE